jgi:hypothetical protein
MNFRQRANVTNIFLKDQFGDNVGEQNEEKTTFRKQLQSPRWKRNVA